MGVWGEIMRKHWQIGLIGAMLLGFALACGEGSRTTAPATESEAPSALTAGVRFAAEVCTEMDGNNCAAPATSFARDTPIIHFAYNTRDLPRTGQTYDIRWIAVDVGDAAPAGTVIDDTPLVVTDALLLQFGTHYSVHGTLTKPTAGWPQGKYQVIVTLDGAPVTSAAFVIATGS